MVTKTKRTENSSSKFIFEDPFLWIPFLLLLGCGIIILYSASFHSAGEDYNNPYYFLKKQTLFLSLGVAALIFFRFFPYNYLKYFAYISVILSFILLSMIFFTPLGHKVGGASRWLRLMGFSFQPSVFSMYAIIIYLAHTISKHKDEMYLFNKGILPHIILFFIYTLFFYNQPDFGTIVLIAALLWIMLICGGARLKHISLISLSGVAIGAILLVQKDYRIARILSFLNPWEYSTTTSYQTTMSLKAFINGGLTGVGFGEGILKMAYLPESHTDFIFSIIGEEAGFIGVITIIFLFAMIIIRGFKIAENAKDHFGSLLAVGITSIIALHVVINMGVTLSILPPKGLPLPFISYGGTSLLMNMAGMGILMNIGAKQNG